MITTLIDRGGNFIVTAKDRPAVVRPIWLRGVDGIDPSLFFDDDSRAYITNNGPPVEAPLYEDTARSGCRSATSPTRDGRAEVGDRERQRGPREKPIWIEAPHILKVKGQYY